LNALRQRWQSTAERIDAMSLRERVIVFVCVTVLMLAALYGFFSLPVRNEQVAVSTAVAQKQVDTRLLQAEVQKILGHMQDDPDSTKRVRLEELRARLANLDARLNEKQREMVAPERVTSLLEEILRRDRRLELVDLRSVPAVPLFEEPDASESKPGEEKHAEERLQVYRHGVELTVRGSYFDLLNYLSDLEALPHRMYWREVDITVDEYPVITMKLSVYTLSLQRTWVVV
jgi:MSHA biogenesis protein MshJ